MFVYIVGMGSSGIEVLKAAVTALLDDPVLERDELIEFVGLTRQVDAAFALAVGAFDRSGAWAFDGRRSMTGWLESQAGMTGREAHRVVRRARFVDACPLTGSVWAAGEVATDMVDRIETVRHAAHADDAFARFEPALLRVAMHGTAADLACAAGRWRDALDAEQQGDIATYAQAQIDREHLHVSEGYFGMGVLAGEFTPEHREQIETALDREIDRLRIPNDPRLLSQLRAEALVSIMRAYNSQAINAGTNQPHISLHVDLATWAGTGIGLSETARGTSLTRDTIARLACNTAISIITHDGTTIPLDMYRASRTFTAHQRRALEHRDGGCRFPGCTRHASATEAHHVDWWELGGETNLENAALLCHFHHRLIHEGRWTIKIDADATIKWFKPDGTYHDTSYPRPPTNPIPARR